MNQFIINVDGDYIFAVIAEAKENPAFCDSLQFLHPRTWKCNRYVFGTPLRDIGVKDSTESRLICFILE
jgi:hypothetical protein